MAVASAKLTRQPPPQRKAATVSRWLKVVLLDLLLFAVWATILLVLFT